MGSVLRFPAERVRGTLYGAARLQSAEILILPVVQIARDAPVVGAEYGEGLWPNNGSAAPSFDHVHPNDGTGRRRRSRRR
jgi:hypothetical protein